MTDSNVHRIRLAGPWEFSGVFEPVFPLHICEEWRRIKLPATWQECSEGESGCAFFRRSFNKPTNLTNETIRLVIPATGCTGEVRLNEEVLGAVTGDEPQQFLIAELQPRNLLAIRLYGRMEDQPAGLSAPVVLELVDHE